MPFSVTPMGPLVIGRSARAAPLAPKAIMAAMPPAVKKQGHEKEGETQLLLGVELTCRQF